MEMVVIFIIVLLFIFGKWLLVKLQKNVSRQEAVYIQKKYFGWIPISVYFLILIITPRYISYLAYFLLTSLGYFQIGFAMKKNSKQTSLFVFLLILIMLSSTLAYYFIPLKNEFLLAVIFGSVFSDISAYSVSKLAQTKHYLPTYINKNKTVEGIIGGILGAFMIIPLLLVMQNNFHRPELFLLAILVGTASTIGDMLNSIIKRRLEIKDWGEIFPGHGGIFDRFISFYMSYTLVSMLTHARFF